MQGAGANFPIGVPVRVKQPLAVVIGPALNHHGCSTVETVREHLRRSKTAPEVNVNNMCPLQLISWNGVRGVNVPGRVVAAYRSFELSYLNLVLLHPIFYCLTAPNQVLC
jgi:hypothetical protein